VEHNIVIVDIVMDKLQQVLAKRQPSNGGILVHMVLLGQQAFQVGRMVLVLRMVLVDP